MVSQSKLDTGVITSVKTQKSPKIYAVPCKGKLLDRLKAKGRSRLRVTRIGGINNRVSFETEPMSNSHICLFCFLDKCLHLSGGSWKLVYSNGKPVKDPSKFVGVTLC